MAILTVPSDLLTGNRQGVSLVAGIALTVVGVFFILMELRAPHMPGEKRRRSPNPSCPSARASSTWPSAARWRR